MFFQKKSIEEIGLFQGFCDIHNHLLYGVDDGSAIAKESLAVLEWMESQGVNTIWCTPHIMEDMPNSVKQLKYRFEELSGLYKGRIHLHLAAEYMLDTLFRQCWQANDLLPLANRFLLVETSCMIPLMGFDAMLFDICNGKYRPILAHPERYSYMNLADYEKYKKRGIHLQLNLMSLCGLYGKDACRKAHELLKQGMYDFVGTDIHSSAVLQKVWVQKCLSSAEVCLLQQLAKNNRLL